MPTSSWKKLPDMHPRVARSLVLAPVALLIACSASVPLPPWTPPPPESSGTQPMAAPAIVATRPAQPQAPAEVVVSPVTSAMPAAPRADDAAPYSAAVTARFPAPSVVYSTPGLQPGRNAFTSAAELRNWLRDQATAAARSGMRAEVRSIGNSQRGESLQVLVLTRANGTSAADLLASGRPTVLMIGQQHGNEPASSEALLVLARELAQGLLQPALEQINVVIVPRANPDGAASDQRATAGGLDMNLDHLLLNTPEAQALARLARDYHPTVVVDVHEYTVVDRYLEKFGAIQKFDALVQYATAANLPEFLTKAAEEWYRRPLIAALSAQGLSHEWYYTTSADPADKKVSMGGTQPDTGRNVYGLKNAVSLLIETRGVGIGRLHIQRRVHTQVTAISSVLASTVQRASELTQLQPYVEKETSAEACRGEAIVEAGPTPAQHELAMLDPISGADRMVTVDWDSALALRTLKIRARPCGYWLSAGSTTAVERLRLHGVQVLRVVEPGSVLADSYSELSRTAGQRDDARSATASRGIITTQVALTRGVLDVQRGGFYVPLNQPLGKLVLAALEPDTQSSYFANQLLSSLDSSVRVMAEPNLKLEELP